MLENRFRVEIEHSLEAFLGFVGKISNPGEKPVVKINSYVTSKLSDYPENKVVLELGSLTIQHVREESTEEDCEFIKDGFDSNDIYLAKGVLAINMSTHLLTEEGYVASFEEAEEMKKNGIFFGFIVRYNLSGFIESLDLRLLPKKEVDELNKRNLVLHHLKGGKPND